MATLNYKADHTDTKEGFDILPAGEYKAVITDSDYAPNKANTGKMLKLTYTIIDGNFKNQKIFNNLNLENPSIQAVNISKTALNSICKALNVIDLQDSSQLHNQPLIIEVTVKESEQYGKQNNIKKHKSISGDVQGQTSAPVQTEQGIQDVGGQPKNPWEK